GGDALGRRPTVVGEGPARRARNTGRRPVGHGRVELVAGHAVRHVPGRTGDRAGRAPGAATTGAPAGAGSGPAYGAPQSAATGGHGARRRGGASLAGV